MIEHPFFDKNIAVNQEQWNIEKERQLSRRRLLELMKIGGGVAATTTLLAACSMGGDNAASTGAPTRAATTNPTQAPTQSAMATPTTAAASDANVIAHTTDIAQNSAKTFTIANQNNPGVLIHLSDDTFVAYDSTCTHQQCAVAYNAGSKLLECPCHGAAFDPASNASVVQGPAQTPLTAIKITVGSDGAITLAQ